MTEQEPKKIFAVSTLYDQAGWYLHYAWAFFADSIEEAAELARAFFVMQQQGIFKQSGQVIRLVSINVVGHGLALNERNDGKGNIEREIVPIGTPNTNLPGPDKIKTPMAA